MACYPLVILLMIANQFEDLLRSQSEQIAQQTEMISRLLAFANSPNNVLQQALPSGAERGGELSKRLKYGQGSIKERKRVNKDGSIYRWYQVRWYDEYGNRQTKTTPTKEEAHKILSQSNNRTMKNVKKHLKTFGEYFYEWYDTFRSSKCGAARNQLNLTQINRIPKEIMDKPLAQITASELQQYLNTIPQEHPRTQTKQLFTACIRHAFGNGQMKNNIGLSLEAEISKAPEKPILPREREKEFIALFPKQYQGYVIGLIYSGARLGEFMSLNENWETDIDYKSEIVKIRETKSLRQKDIKAGTTYVVREIPLLPEFAKIKFPLPVVKQKTINKIFTKVVGKFGLHLTPHCMRHTFISRCNELGIATSIIRGMVGHKTERMTIHYTHNTAELTDREYKKLKESTPISTPIRAEND